MFGVLLTAKTFYFKYSLKDLVLPRSEDVRIPHISCKVQRSELGTVHLSHAGHGH